MAEETPRSNLIPDIPQVAAPFDASQTLPTQPLQTDCSAKDVVMSDAPLEQHVSRKSSPTAPAHAPSPLPGRTGTPAQGSRAASAHPDPGFSMPAEAPPHGDSTRRYLNMKVTGVLLEGMKQLAKEQPSDPLRVLGEYLIQRSKEFEGTGST